MRPIPLQTPRMAVKQLKTFIRCHPTRAQSAQFEIEVR
jgi:hypothetical protein